MKAADYKNWTDAECREFLDWLFNAEIDNELSKIGLEKAAVTDSETSPPPVKELANNFKAREK